jgi:hypothetical protein
VDSGAGCSHSACSGVSAPDDIADIGWPPAAVDAGRKEARMDKVEVVRRECEPSVQVIDLSGVVLATVSQGYTSNQPGNKVTCVEMDSF